MSASADECYLNASIPFTLRLHLTNCTSNYVTIHTPGTILDLHDALRTTKFEVTNTLTGLKITDDNRSTQFDTVVHKNLPQLLRDFITIHPNATYTVEHVLNAHVKTQGLEAEFGGLKDMPTGEVYTIRPKSVKIRSWWWGSKQNAMRKAYRVANGWKIESEVMVIEIPRGRKGEVCFSLEEQNSRDSISTDS